MANALIERLSGCVTEAIAKEPGITIDVRHDQTMVGFWFECATGRTYVCAIGKSVSEAYDNAVRNRKAKIAEAVVEVEVRAEIKARMAKSA